jgi:hypothetical protein
MKKGADFGPDFPMKGWKLDTINDTTCNKPKKGCCDYCHAHLRSEYCLTHPDSTFYLVVGSECVNSFSDSDDIAVARKFFNAEWSQRRGYYWKQAHGRVWIVKRNQFDKWSVAYTPSVRASLHRWVWSRVSYRTSDDAFRAVLGIVCKGRDYIEDHCEIPVAAERDWVTEGL